MWKIVTHSIFVTAKYYESQYFFWHEGCPVKVGCPPLHFLNSCGSKWFGERLKQFYTIPLTFW